MIKIDDLEAYTNQEISEKLGISVYTVRKYIKDGKLRAKKIGGHWYVTKDILKEFIAVPEKE